MNTHVPGRPDSSEYAPHAAQYVELVSGDDPLPVLAQGLKDDTALFLSLDERQGGFSYAPGKWTLKQVLGHVIDTERIFAYRTLCVARNDTTPLPGFDQDLYAQFAASDERTLADLVQEFQAVRQSTIALFATFRPEAWLRRGAVSGVSVTTRGLAFCTAGHALHHRKIVRENYLQIGTA